MTTNQSETMLSGLHCDDVFLEKREKHRNELLERMKKLRSESHREAIRALSQSIMADTLGNENRGYNRLKNT